MNCKQILLSLTGAMLAAATGCSNGITAQGETQSTEVGIINNTTPTNPGPGATLEAFPEEETEGRKATAGDTFSRFCVAAVLFVFVGIPALIVLLCLAAAGIALFVSGFVMIVAGFADFVYFIVQICTYGVTGAYIAHLGIGIGCTALGFLLTPLFMHLTKWLFKGCGKIFVWTGNFISAKRRKK